MMLGWRINQYMKIGWTVASPIFCITVFILSAITYSELDYKRPQGTYEYPSWGVGIGWSLACMSAMWIPITWVYHIVRYGQDWETFKLCFKPLNLKEHQLRPQDHGEVTLASLKDPVTSDAVYAAYRRKISGAKPEGIDNLAMTNSQTSLQ